jgi:hypothetical protein
MKEFAIGRLIARCVSWCPPEYRADYGNIVWKGFSDAEARRMIEAQIARDAARKTTSAA